MGIIQSTISSLGASGPLMMSHASAPSEASTTSSRHCSSMLFRSVRKTMSSSATSTCICLLLKERLHRLRDGSQFCVQSIHQFHGPRLWGGQDGGLYLRGQPGSALCSQHTQRALDL